MRETLFKMDTTEILNRSSEFTPIGDLECDRCVAERAHCADENLIANGEKCSGSQLYCCVLKK